MNYGLLNLYQKLSNFFLVVTIIGAGYYSWDFNRRTEAGEEKGTINIATNLNARVSIYRENDILSVHITPTTVELPIGQYILEASRTGYQSQRFFVDVGISEQTVFIHLLRSPNWTPLLESSIRFPFQIDFGAGRTNAEDLITTLPSSEVFGSLNPHLEDNGSYVFEDVVRSYAYNHTTRELTPTTTTSSMALPAFVQPLAAQFPEVGAFYTALSPSGRYFMFPHFADENESEVSLWIADLEEQRLYDTEYLLSAPFHPWTALTEQIATWSEDSEQLLVGPRPEELALIKIASPIEESTSIHLLSELPSGTHFIVEDTTENLELILTTTSLGSEITYYLVDTNDGDEPTSRVIDIPLSTARFCGHETLILVSSSNALLVTNLATDETETLASTEELGLSGPNQIHRISISPSLEYAYVYHQNASNPRANAILWSVDLTEYLNPIPCYSAE